MSTFSPTSRSAGRIDVRSADGTSIAVWVRGAGPALVLVHGSPADHHTFDGLVDELARDVTTWALDRRGSGSSGDSASYALQREFGDVAAVVEAAAERSGGSVGLWGHSYGANTAMGGATLTSAVHHLVLYEPTLALPYPSGALETIERAVAAGDREGAVRAALVETGALTAAEFSALRRSDRWPSVLQVAPTLARECRAEADWAYRPGQFDAITAHTLLLTGADSAPVLGDLTRRAAAAIPSARVEVLEGHGHLAHGTDPALVAGIIRAFLTSPGP